MLILVVEDDQHTQREIKEAFEDDGHEVLLATNGRDALEMFKENCHLLDAVTIDILLPDIDGIRLLRMLVEKDPTIPKIMYTAYDYRDDFAVRASHAYLIKSSPHEKLVQIVIMHATTYRAGKAKNKL